MRALVDEECEQERWEFVHRVQPGRQGAKKGAIIEVLERHFARRRCQSVGSTQDLKLIEDEVRTIEGGDKKRVGLVATRSVIAAVVRENADELRFVKVRKLNPDRMVDDQIAVETLDQN